MVLAHFLLIILSCIIIWRASDDFEVASEFIGRKLSDGVRGATINAIGSSLPELFTTLFFLFVMHEQDGFSGGVGTTAGSAVFNAMVIPAAVVLVVIWSGVAKSITISTKVLRRDGLWLIASEILLIAVLGSNALHWWHGLLLMSMYVCYVTYMLKTMSVVDHEDEDEKTADEDEDNDEQPSFILSLLKLELRNIVIGNRSINNTRAWSLLALSMSIIAVACFFLVQSCEHIGTALKINVYFIAVILAAAATSVPDTILSIRDAQKGNYDDAVSNALGSNIFDICFALGLPLFLYTLLNGPIEMTPATIIGISELWVLLLFLTIWTLFIFIAGKKMGLIKGFLLFLTYLAFIGFISGKALEADWALSIGSFLQDIADIFGFLRI